MTTAPFATKIADAMDTLKREFGEEIQIRPRDGRAYTIIGIFDEAHAVIENSGEVAHETVKPVVSIATRDLRNANRATPKRGDTFTIRGKQYAVAEVMPDGHAEVRFVLAQGVTRA